MGAILCERRGCVKMRLVPPGFGGGIGTENANSDCVLPQLVEGGLNARLVGRAQNVEIEAVVPSFVLEGMRLDPGDVNMVAGKTCQRVKQRAWLVDQCECERGFCRARWDLWIAGDDKKARVVVGIVFDVFFEDGHGV